MKSDRYREMTESAERTNQKENNTHINQSFNKLKYNKKFL